MAQSMAKNLVAPQTPPPRMKKADRSLVRRHLEKVAEELIAAGAAHAVVEEWSNWRVALIVFYGPTADPNKPHATCDHRDWLWAEWDKHDSAWRLYGAGVPLHTEKTLHVVLGRWRVQLQRFGMCRESWSRLKQSKSVSRWQDYLGSVAAVLGIGERGDK